jgi:hypothetical protein
MGLEEWLPPSLLLNYYQAVFVGRLSALPHQAVRLESEFFSFILSQLIR